MLATGPPFGFRIEGPDDWTLLETAPDRWTALVSGTTSDTRHADLLAGLVRRMAGSLRVAA
jgi:predicted RNA methylase